MSADAISKNSESFFPALKEHLASRVQEFGLIPDQRKSELEKLATYIQNRRSQLLPAKLIFVCTHNSRRSHLSQIWARVAADYYGVDAIETYSGGTEATAFNPRAVAALQRAGLQIMSNDSMASNPLYQVTSSDTGKPQLCFSKLLDAPTNPSADYCAVMTCSQADEACPVVPGCDLRLPIRYDDPKVADDTEQEANRYDERSNQICREMLYLISMVKK